MGLYSHSIGGKRKLADLILHEDKEKIWEKDVFEKCRHTTVQYFLLLLQVFWFESTQWISFSWVLSVCCSRRQSWKTHKFTGRSTKTSKQGLAHKKLYNKQIRHNCQPGKSNSVIKLLQVLVFFFHYFIFREYWICPFHLIIYFIRLAWLLLHAQSRFFSYEEEGCPKSPFFCNFTMPSK